MFSEKCKHEWEVQTDTILKSGYEQIAKSSANHKYNFKDTPLAFWQNKHVFIMTCKKCGEIHKSVEKNIP